MKYKIQTRSVFKDIEDSLFSELHSAKSSIKICVAWINFELFENILLSKAKEGIEIEILVNNDYINTKFLDKISNDIKPLINLIKNPINNHLMHHKFCIIDDEVLITGSYNWSKKAPYHYENIIIIRNDFNLIMQFKHEFADLKYMGAMPSTEFNAFKVTKNLNKFVVGTYSSSVGIYETVTLQLWEIDINNLTYERHGEMDIPFFNYLLDINTDDHYLIDEKERYIDLYDQERRQMENIQSYFRKLNCSIHAYGTAIIANESEYLEGYEEPIRVIHFNWIDMRLSKVLPSSLPATMDLEGLWHEIYAPNGYI